MSMLQFNVRETVEPAAMIIELTGTIDTSRCVENLYNLVTRSAASKMVIQMKGVDYINSAGFAEVVQLAQAARAKGKRLVFSQLTIKVKSVFEGLGGGRLLDIVDSEDEALARLA